MSKHRLADKVWEETFLHGEDGLWWRYTVPHGYTRFTHFSQNSVDLPANPNNLYDVSLDPSEWQDLSIISDDGFWSIPEWGDLDHGCDGKADNDG